MQLPPFEGVGEGASGGDAAVALGHWIGAISRDEVGWCCPAPLYEDLLRRAVAEPRAASVPFRRIAQVIVGERTQAALPAGAPLSRLRVVLPEERWQFASYRGIMPEELREFKAPAPAPRPVKRRTAVPAAAGGEARRRRRAEDEPQSEAKRSRRALLGAIEVETRAISDFEERMMRSIAHGKPGGMDL